MKQDEVVPVQEGGELHPAPLTAGSPLLLKLLQMANRTNYVLSGNPNYMSVESDIMGRENIKCYLIMTQWLQKCWLQ